jgi:hypothetical protein
VPSARRSDEHGRATCTTGTRQVVTGGRRDSRRHERLAVMPERPGGGGLPRQTTVVLDPRPGRIPVTLGFQRSEGVRYPLIEPLSRARR